MLGRLHPAVVHFPIALIITAAVLEAWNMFLGKRKCSATALVCLRLGALSALVAALFGWIHADHEPHGIAVQDAIFWHRWVGVGALVLALVSAVAAHRARLVYRLALAGACLCVSIAGHLGGELVHGEGYVTAVFDERERGEPAAPAGDLLYTQTVQPLLEAHCIRCHGPDKKKGKLRLDSKAEIFQGDRPSWLVVSGKPEQSELLRRVSLPVDDIDIMPPEGEPLDAASIEILRAWIQSGPKWPE